MSSTVHRPDPDLDLVLERVVDVPASFLWDGWTRPEMLKRWFTPAPWQTVDCTIDLRPGGVFRTVMRGPDGQEFDNAGCYLEIVEHEKLVWTGALGSGYRPLSREAMTGAPFLITAIITLAAEGDRTRYTAVVLHGDRKARETHEQMGFHTGWGIALDQLVALAG